MTKEYLIYCDESVEKAKHYSDFYGGLLVRTEDLDKILTTLEEKKEELNLFNEVKWTRVTEPYLDKYIALVDTFFELIASKKIKVRIMFRQSAYQANNLTDYNKEHGYFLLYYQFIKHAFGLKYSNTTGQPIYLRLFFDELPDSKTKAQLFKNHIHALQTTKGFTEANIKIRKRDIGEVKSHEHNLMQCLDIVLGAMSFRLNDMHKVKDPNTNKRGKRTIAKEKLYKHILSKIQRLKKNFNIGISTGKPNGLGDYWEHEYRHWRFQPKDFILDDSKFK